MSLDAQTRALIAQAVKQNAPPLHSLTPEEARRFLKTMPRGAGQRIARLEDRSIPGPAGHIPIRIYTPKGAGPLPVLVYFHGGGFVIGDLDTYDALCRSLANGGGCMVISVAYRLAPEHKFPAAPEDCYAATKWAAINASLLNGDPARIAVGGESAGGTLAAVVAQMTRDRGGPPLAFQLMIYPTTDLTADTPSLRDNAEGYLLTARDLAWFMGHYLNNDEDKKHPLASPMLAGDLSGLPPALIITAEFDPLRDEAELYGRRLREAGVPVTISRYEGTIHAFVSFAAVLDQGKRAIRECCSALRTVFAPARGSLLS